ncbi:hypothetical protein [Oricola sp.]|uniref:hypothetical protein n=1 Tax=Oricola sp. TaxID=1979950 RepID=UPI0025E80129|nr:hypothetical protein [Oricola sp.]MCI5074034.1 hypothetical protein [Oricola sp.]
MARGKDNRTDAGAKTGLRELTQFEKGLLKEAGRKVTVRVDGKAVEADLAQVVTSKLFAVAAQGSPHALGHVLRSINEAQKLNQALVREEVERGRNIRKSLEEHLARAVRNGADPIWVVPHPDDIVITEGEGWALTGPVDEDGLKPIQERVGMRDVLLLQSVLDERSGHGDGDGGSASDVPMAEQAGSASTAFAMMLNDSMPERFRMSTLEMVFVTDRHHRLTKRELLKTTYRAWAAIGQPKPRGTTLPPWCEVEPRVERLAAVLRRVLDEIRADDLVSGHQIALSLQDLLRPRGAEKA